MQNFIVYTAFEKNTVDQCRYALLKYLEVYNLKPPPSTGIVVRTHWPAAFEVFTSFFPGFELIYDKTAEKKEQNNASLLSFLKTLLAERNADLLYCDCAAYPVKPLEDLFAQITKQGLVLYCVKKIGKRAAAAVQQTALLTKQIFKDGNPHVEAGRRLGRATVAGINPQQRTVLDEAQAIGNALRGKIPAPVAEPLALAYCFQRRGNVGKADGYFRYYGGFREFDDLLHTFFKRNEEESIPNLVKAVHPIDAAAIQEQKTGYEQLPFYEKWFRRFTGKGWSIRKYEKKIIR